MTKAKSATFGRLNRDNAPVARREQNPGQPWVMLAAAGLLVCILAAGALHLFTGRINSPDSSGTGNTASTAVVEENGVFSTAFLMFVEAEPRRSRELMVAALDSCMPDNARDNWTGAAVKNLAADIQIKIFSLVARHTPAEQRDQELRAFILSSAVALAREHRENFTAIARNVLLSPEVGLCSGAEFEAAMAQ